MFQDRLSRSRNGRGILFCGAGFSADALNFTQETIGAGAQLLSFLNKSLADAGKDSGYKSLRNAAEAANTEFGEHGLLSKLLQRYKVKNASLDMVEICRFPWERIYTTNYDNAVELSLSRSSIKFKSINNTDSSSDLSKDSVNIIHLHGFIDSWNIHNFSNSCVLTSESYHNLSFIDPWLDLFRQDLDRAEAIFFVGFNVEDFHLNQVLRNVTGIREKVYFINRETAEPDIDVRMTQGRFGAPVYIGRRGFADSVRNALEAEKPSDPVLSSFERFSRKAPASGVPSTRSIENLFLFGEVDEEQLARDVDEGLSDYRVSRELCTRVIDAFSGKVKISLITGDICDGKSFLIKELVRRIDISRPVFILRIPYDDLLEEVSRILDSYPSAALVIESCFEISREKLVSLARQVDSSNSVLLLSARNIAAEARQNDLSALRSLSSFREFQMERLDDVEITKLVALADQIAGWSEFGGRSLRDRKVFVKITCNSSLPSFLLRLLHSNYVRNRYREEFNKIANLNPTERHAIIAALYVAHIGERASISLLSDVFELDMGALVQRLERSGTGLLLLRLRGNFIETVPAIGATNILKEVVSDKDIVDSVVSVLTGLSETDNQDQFRRHIFSQMMRYSIVRPVIDDETWITRFFDNVSKIEYVRRHVLFWLQWSIALREQRAFVESEKKLDQAYREAEIFEKKRGIQFDRRQLDDVRAKFLVARATVTHLASPALFRDLRASCEIVGSLLRLAELTHHPFETLESIAELYASKSSSIDKELRDTARDIIDKLLSLAEKRIGSAPAGYQETMASRALNNAKARIRALS